LQGGSVKCKENDGGNGFEEFYFFTALAKSYFLARFLTFISQLYNLTL